MNGHFTAALGYRSGSSLSTKSAENIPRSWGLGSESDPLAFFPAHALGLGRRKVAPEMDSAEKINLLTRTVNISVGKCVAQRPGRVIGDPF